MSTLMVLGVHRFSVDALNYQKLTAISEARWKENFTANGGHIDVFLGAAPHKTTVRGVLYPMAFGGYGEASAISTSVDAGKPLPMFTMTGNNFGLVKLHSFNLVDEKTGPNGIITEASFDLTVSAYSGTNNLNPLMSSVGGAINTAVGAINTVVGAVNTVRSLF
ncbi:MAG: phage tail protein [Cohaesibacteraceae bacterium]|nr:phage tail protein [Cohaesibacteraceae bacterium]MBL4876719.1 phage tail protein [Cohaesibacteraceae bacterium]